VRDNHAGPKGVHAFLRGCADDVANRACERQV